MTASMEPWHRSCLITSTCRLHGNAGLVDRLGALSADPDGFPDSHPNGNQDIQAKVMTTLSAEVEGDLISERAREGRRPAPPVALRLRIPRTLRRQGDDGLQRSDQNAAP